jgi:SRSO17 transposase
VIDRELYLPHGWIDDPARCRAAGVPDQVGFATKPELARVMPQRALEAGVSAGWVTADEVDGGSPALRGWLEGRQLPYVLAVKATEPLRSPSPCGPSAPAQLAEQIPSWCWLRLSAGQGAKAVAGMGGPACRWPARARPPGGAAGCWCAAAFAPGSLRTTCALARLACR